LCGCQQEITMCDCQLGLIQPNQVNFINLSNCCVSAIYLPTKPPLHPPSPCSSSAIALGNSPAHLLLCQVARSFSPTLSRYQTSILVVRVEPKCDCISLDVETLRHHPDHTSAGIQQLPHLWEYCWQFAVSMSAAARPSHSRFPA
jgi:hypothetical protein